MPLKRPVQIENHKGFTIRLSLLGSKGCCIREQAWKANCLVLQWWKITRAAFRSLDEANTRDILNTLQVIRSPNLTSRSFLYLEVDAIDDIRGIVVGTGTTPVEYDDYKLETKIAHGAGAGQFMYGAVDVAAVAAAANHINLTVSRSFTNASGGAITINEIGLDVECYCGDLAYHQFLITRDIVTGGFAVAAGETVAATITLFTPF